MSENIEVKAKIYRTNYTARTTTGGLYFIDDWDNHLCYTLEDTVRAYGIKVKKETALPAGLYKLGITFSTRFQREMPIIYTENNRYEILKGGMRFVGCRLHGGNTHKSTEGCPCVAYNKIDDDTIQGTAEKAVTSKIKDLISKVDEDFVWLEVINGKQSN